MVVAGERGDLHLATLSLELLVLNAQLFGRRAKELAQETHNAGFFAGSRRTIEE